jgi:DNA polymerase-3 subunit epsilon
MQLNLKNPLIIFDLETTGMNISTDRIVEISYLKIYPNGKEEGETIRLNPEMPIPATTTAIHGITDEDVANAPTFASVAKNLAKKIEGCDLAGYNSNRFDIPLLAEEFLRAEIDIDLMRRKFIDVQTIFYKKEPRTLSAAFKFYCNGDIENAHSAEADTRATYEVLKAQLDRYSDLENDVNYLSKFSAFTRNADFAGRIIYNDNEDEVFNFGKYKGQKVVDVLKKDPGYYGWIMQGDFTLHTKKIITNIKLRSFNK